MQSYLWRNTPSEKCRRLRAWLVPLVLFGGWPACGLPPSDPCYDSSEAPFILKKHNLDSELLIAHAGGAYRGLTYTNSLEALSYSYEQRRLRIFEIDVSRTTDGRLVLMHLWRQEGMRYFGRAHRPTHEEFMSWRMVLGMTQLDLEGALDWLEAHPDARFVIDTKESDVVGLMRDIWISAGRELAARIIPQVQWPEQYEPVVSIGYDKIILTLYRFRGRADDLIAFAGKSDIVGVAMPVAGADTGLPSRLHDIGKPTYLHTVNSLEEVIGYQQLCIYGYMTDRLGADAAQKLMPE